jgi:hypothetical protein
VTKGKIPSLPPSEIEAWLSSLQPSHYTELRRTLGPKREGVAGSWRRLHNEELPNLYLPPDIIRRKA